MSEGILSGPVVIGMVVLVLVAAVAVVFVRR